MTSSFPRRLGASLTVYLVAVLGLCLASCGPKKHRGDPDSGPGGDASSDASVEADAEVEPPFDEAHYYVATTGNDSSPGTLEAPFRTLGRARQAVRDHRASQGLPAGGLVVAIRSGVYEQGETFTLSAEDSGDATAPVFWVAYPGEEVRLSGGTRVDPAWLTVVNDLDPAWNRLPVPARGQVVSLDLEARGFDGGTLRRRGFGTWQTTGALEVVWNGSMLTLARWPNFGQTDLEAPEAPAVLSGDIFGAGTTFAWIGTTATGNADDGYPNYQGNQGGQDYFLYHCTWDWGGATHRYWFVSASDPRTSPDCWPDGQTSWLQSGEWPPPDLEPFGGAAASEVIPAIRPEDFADHGFLRVPEAIDGRSFRLPGARHEAWTTADDPWFQGLFYELWADDTLPGQVASDGVVTLDEEPVYGIRRGRPFFALNLLEELDSPGEYYVDRTTGMLYVWPTSPAASAQVNLTLLEEPILRVTEAAHLRFVGLTFELGRARLVEAESVDDVVFRQVTLRYSGSDGIRISGTRSGLAECHLHDFGGRAAALDGGHRPSLTRGDNFVRSSDIHHFGRWDRTYREAVRLSGCGQIVEDNYLHDAPHAAIQFSGNDHRIERNLIARVVQEANDAGAIYAGRDWGYRGTLIRHNIIRDVRSIFGGSHGVYLDDSVSGMRVLGNILYGFNGLATLSGGGRDNIFEGNIIVDAKSAAHSTDRRGRTSNYDFNTDGCPDDWNLLGRLNVVYETYYSNLPDGDPIAYQSEPWSSAYPEAAAIPNDWTQVEGSHWQDPEGCTFRYNLVWRSGGTMNESTWGGEGALGFYESTEPNLEEVDPGFVDEASGDLRLRSDSPVFTTPGFQFDPIPVEEIGP
ncbi:MAG: right-handed parallel beta-helix repeat-containing protein [Polyangia bacterium]|jgi:hypothetical protein|nr:right-handed parallel beta-helix repeat-containing protein [Polyangia bacterium]